MPEQRSASALFCPIQPDTALHQPTPNPAAPAPDGSDQPLTLTVHALPSPHDLAVPPSRSGSRWKLLAIVLICSLPVLVSYYAYFVVRPEGRAAYGELITPARPAPDATGTDLEGASHPLSALKKQWLLVAVAGGNCTESCSRELYLQRQLREMLGKDKARVDRVWLVNDDAPVPAELRRHLGETTVLRVSPTVLDTWFGAPSERALTDHFYVVDPLGNAMMRMAANMDAAAAAKARRDLERLLRASASWDEPGR